MKLNTKSLLIVCWVCLICTGAQAGQPTGPGPIIVAKDGSGDYTCIQAAIDDYSATEILVMPGTYTENILITKDLTIRAYDGPLTTIIDGSRQLRWNDYKSGKTVYQAYGIDINPGQKVTLQGLCVTNAQHGVFIRANDNVIIENCVFWGNREWGISIINDYARSNDPITHIRNCVVVNNGWDGIFIGQYHSSGFHYCPPTIVQGSILVANGGYGIKLCDGGHLRSTDNISLDYNCSVGNGVSNYGPGIGSEQVISEGLHSFSLSPYFVNGNTGDFRLAPWSPCIDAGSAGTGFMDPDGTVNDIGAYGGPGSVSFFESPTDGPIVREVTVTPGSVAQGSTLRIQAKGSVR